MEPITKPCKCCKKQLPLSKYPKRKQTKDGHTAWCEDCLLHYKTSRLSSQKVQGVEHRDYYVQRVPMEDGITRIKIGDNYHTQHAQRHSVRGGMESSICRF